ncbi:NADP-dependent oxidoreductase [Neorhizobium sp. DT-125]|uniref:NADP-dependent oxidoreductase n=1 Tax=Neorhizobium sp. DT-125 TaxID=3396163 RepID=UPI003F1CCC6B
MTKTVNRQVQLVRRPQGAPVPGDFRIVDCPVPMPSEGELLLRNLYLSLDPYMRGRMNDSHESYARPYALDAPPGGGTVARVVRSRLDSFAEGDLVVTPDAGWQTFAISDGTGLRCLPNDMAQPSQALGVLGMTGFTAWWGLTAIGRPQAGETLVVSAAAGAVGSVVGQIGRLLGCRVVGIAGGADKCRQVVEELSFDACLNYRAPDLAGRLREAAPDGIDIYFENVGGAVREAVWPLLNNDARVPICGLVSGYNGVTEGAGGVHALLMSLIVKRIRLQGFMNADHLDSFPDFERQMRGWLDAGQLRAHETIVDGLDQAPTAFVGLFEGHNTGKLVVRLLE